MKQKYINAYMGMAEVFAETSEAKRLKVGALIIKNGGIISEGVNGTPSGFYTNDCELPDGTTAPEVFHAEINALNKLRKGSNTSSEATMFVTHAPCRLCAINIVDAGIKQVFYKDVYRSDEGLKYLNDRGIEVVKL